MTNGPIGGWDTYEGLLLSQGRADLLGSDSTSRASLQMASAEPAELMLVTDNLRESILGGTGKGTYSYYDWTIQDGIGIKNPYFSYRNRAFCEDTFISTDPAVLTKIAELRRINKEFGDSFFQKRINTAPTIGSFALMGAGGGATAANHFSSGNLWWDAAGMAIGATVSLIASISVLGGVSGRLYDPVSHGISELHEMVANSPQTYVIPNNLKYNPGLGNKIAEIVQGSLDRPLEFEKVLPVAEAIVKAEIELRKIDPQFQKIDKRSEATKKIIEKVLAADNPELDKLGTIRQQLIDETNAKWRELLKIRSNQTSTEEFKNALRKMTPDKKIVLRDMRDLLTGISDTLQAVYSPEITGAAVDYINDFSKLMTEFSLEKNPERIRLLTLQAYEALRIKYAKKMLILPTVEVLQDQIAQKTESR